MVESRGKVVNAAEVGRMLGVSRRRVGQLATSVDDFPFTNFGARGYRIWLRDLVERWALSHPDRELRGPKPDLPTVGDIAPQAQEILTLACAEARELNHTGVATDHLVLGLLRPDSPGAAREVLHSLGFELEETRDALVESWGDAFPPHDRKPQIAPATQLVLARANGKALELQDEEVASEHVLLALTDEWHEAPWVLRRREIDTGILWERVLAITEGSTPVSELSAARALPTSLAWPPLGPELAVTPAGHDPRRRTPWGSVALDNGGQYLIDRDGHPVRTTDGQRVHFLCDEEGEPVRAEAGAPVLIVGPEGTEQTLDPRP